MITATFFFFKKIGTNLSYDLGGCESVRCPRPRPPSQDAFKLKDLQTLHVRQRAPRAAAVSHPLAPCGPSLTRPRCVQDACVK